MTGRPIALLVCNDQRVRRSLRNSLRGSGYEVVSSVDGDEAVDISSLWPPELAIIDQDLDGTTGALLVKRLRRCLGGELSAFYPSVRAARDEAHPLVLLRKY